MKTLRSLFLLLKIFLQCELLRAQGEPDNLASTQLEYRPVNGQTNVVTQPETPPTIPTSQLGGSVIVPQQRGYQPFNPQQSNMMSFQQSNPLAPQNSQLDEMNFMANQRAQPQMNTQLNMMNIPQARTTVSPKPQSNEMNLMANQMGQPKLNSQPNMINIPQARPTVLAKSQLDELNLMANQRDPRPVNSPTNMAAPSGSGPVLPASLGQSQRNSPVGTPGKIESTQRSVEYFPVVSFGQRPQAQLNSVNGYPAGSSLSGYGVGQISPVGLTNGISINQPSNANLQKEKTRRQKLYRQQSYLQSLQYQNSLLANPLLANYPYPGQFFGYPNDQRTAPLGMIPVNTIGPNSYAPPGFAQGGPTSLPIRQEASSGRAADLKSTDISDQGIQSSNSIMQDRAPANPCEISDVGSTWGRPLWWGVSRPEGCNPKINQAETPLPAQGSRSLNVMAQPTQNNPFAPGNQMNKVNLMIPQNQINPIIPQNQMAPMISQNQINPIISQNQMNPMISQNQMSPMLLPNQMNPTMFSLDENYPQGPTV